MRKRGEKKEKPARKAGEAKRTVTGTHKRIPDSYWDLDEDGKLEFARRLLEEINPGRR